MVDSPNRFLSRCGDDALNFELSRLRNEGRFDRELVSLML